MTVKTLVNCLLTVQTGGMQFFSLGNFHCLLSKGQCVLYIRQTNFRTLNTILQKSIIEKVVHSVDTKLQGYIPENPQCLIHAYNEQLKSNFTENSTK